MLLNLLPGLRDLRTPLAVGYLWLATGWLLFSGAFPSRSEATGVAASVYRFTDVAGTGTALAVLSFVAYVLGAVLSLQYIVRGALTAPWERRRDDPEAFLRGHPLRGLGLGFVDESTFSGLVRAIRSRIRAAVAADPNDMRRIQDLAGIPGGPGSKDVEDRGPSRSADAEAERAGNLRAQPPTSRATSAAQPHESVTPAPPCP